ncbi:hypothetical protein Lal_00011316 [Lupinus albus]|nr:hypothetical protein Lal_00011316 [Lupinus albus]
MFGHHEIADFATLVNKCRMYEDDLVVDEVVTPRTNPPRHFGPQRSYGHGKGKSKVFQEERKPYSPPAGNQGNSSHVPRPHAKAGGSQSQSSSFCNKCGKTHVDDLCRSMTLSCFHCKETGHTKRYCPKLQQSMNAVRVERPQSTGRVFTMNGAEAANADGLIQGNCLVIGIPLLMLFDSGARHSFISVEFGNFHCLSFLTRFPQRLFVVVTARPAVHNLK